MSTLPNLMMDISSRIAKARGPVDMNLLMTEIHESPLADGAKQTLLNLLALRFEAERALRKEISGGGVNSSEPAADSLAGVTHATAGDMTLEEFNRSLKRATRVTDVSWLMTAWHTLKATAEQKALAWDALCMVRERLCD